MHSPRIRSWGLIGLALLACRSSARPAGSRAAPDAAPPASAPAAPLPPAVARLLEGGCASLLDGRTVCPDPVQGVPEQGCVMRAASAESPARDEPERLQCKRDAEGAAWCWGKNEEGGLGDGKHHVSATPVRVKLSGFVTRVAVGIQHACALLVNGEVHCWGENARGAVGAGVLPPCCDGVEPDPERPPEYLIPVRVRGLPPVESIHARDDASCALTRDGEIYCWGENGSGQLGSAASEPLAAPTLVRGLPPASQLVMSEPSCALARDGRAFCWGDGCPLLERTHVPLPVSWQPR